MCVNSSCDGRSFVCEFGVSGGFAASYAAVLGVRSGIPESESRTIQVVSRRAGVGLRISAEGPEPA